MPPKVVNLDQYKPGQEIRFQDNEKKRLASQAIARANAEEAINLSTKSVKRSRPILLTLFLVLASFYSLAVCPYDTNKQYAVCRALDTADSYRSHAIHSLDNLGRPYLKQADKFAEPYVAPFKPYYNKAHALTEGPVKQYHAIYDKQIQPRLAATGKSALKQLQPVVNSLQLQYERIVVPFLERYQRGLHKIYTAHVGSYVTYISRQATNIRRQLDQELRPTWDRLHKTHLPAIQRYYSRTVQPAIISTVRQTQRLYTSHLYPSLLRSWKVSQHFVRRVILPGFNRFYSLYIRPQVNRVTDRFFDRRAGKLEKDSEAEVRAAFKNSETEAVEHEAGSVQNIEVVEDHNDEEIDDDLDEFIAELRQDSFTATPSQTHAFDPVPVATPSVEVTQQASDHVDVVRAEIAEKRQTLVAKHAAYEEELTRLGEREQALLVERLESIRDSSEQDIPGRFDAYFRSFEQDLIKHSKKLERYFAKVAAKRESDPDSFETETIERHAQSANSLVKKALGKMSVRTDELQTEIDEYKKTHLQREQAAADRACEAVKTFVASVQADLSHEYAWLEDVTPKDWTRYHELGKKEAALCSKYRSLPDATASAAPKVLDDLADKVEQSFDSFEDDLYASSKKAIKAMQSGSVSTDNVKDRLLAIKDAMLNIRDEAAASVQDATRTVASMAGFEPTPTDVQGTLSSVVGDASRSASIVLSDANIVGRAATILDDTRSAVESNIVMPLVSGAKDASHAALNALDLEPSPTNIRQSAASLVQSLSSQVSSVVGSASQVYLNAIDVEPSPTNLGQSATSFFKDAQATASAWAGGLDDSINSVIDAGSIQIGEASSQISQVVHRATKQAAQVVGVHVEPDGIKEHLEASLSLVLSAGESATKAAAENLNRGADAANSAGAAAVSSASSAVSKASAYARDAAEQVVSPHASNFVSSASSQLAANVHDAYSAISSKTRTAKQAAGMSVSAENPSESLSSVISQVTKAASSLSESARQAASSLRSRVEL